MSSSLVSSLVNPNPPVRHFGQHQLCVFGNSISESLNNFGLWFARRSGGEIVFKTNAGVGGNTTPQMLGRLDDIDGTLVTVMEATNDADSAIDAPTHAANIRQILDYIIDEGMEPIMVLSPPNDDDDDTDGVFERSRLVYEMNLYDYVSARKRHLKIFSPWDAYCDPATGKWVAGASGDGTHPNAPTEKAVGEAMCDDLKAGRFYIPLPRINDLAIPFVILNNNSCFLGGTYGGNNYPNGWAMNGSQVSHSLAETTLGLGNTWHSQWANTSLFINSSRWPITPGDTYLCVMRFESVLNSGAADLSVFVQYCDAQGNPFYVNGVDRVYLMREAAVSVDATTLSVELTVPPGVYSLRFAISANAGTYDLDIRIAQAQMFNLTHFGL